MPRSGLVSIESAPHRLEEAYSSLFTKECLKFLEDLVSEFDKDVDKVNFLINLFFIILS